MGAAWRDAGGRHEARARREVILCGGAFNSPHLLHISGIGPPALLKAKGIEVVHALNGVGENLQDHFGIGLQFRSKSRTTVNDLYNNRARGGLQLLRYLLLRTGPFADNGNYSNTFIHSSPDLATPDMMVTFMAWCTQEDLTPFPFSGFTILAEHMRPSQRGYVRARSADPADPPEIRFNFFKSEADQRAALAGFKFARKISRTQPMSDCVEKEIAPGPGVGTDEEIIAYCREAGLTRLASAARAGWGSAPTPSSTLGSALLA